MPSIMRPLRLISRVSLAAIATLAVGACSQPAPATNPAVPAGPATVEVVPVVEKPVDVTLDIPGELNSFQAVGIFPKVTGFVTAIRVDRGSRVRKGDLIAEIDAPELVAQRAEAQSKLQGTEAQLAAAKAKLDASTSTYERLKAASATPGVVAGNDLLLAEKAVEADRNQMLSVQQGLEAARQAVAAIRQMESYLKITAPFDGVITERNVHPGALVGAASGPDAALPLVRLADNSRLRLVVPVPEAYIGGVKPGAAITYSVAEFPGRALTGTVARLAETVDPRTRTMPVEIDVMNADGKLSPGSFCQVKWTVHRTNPSLFVPSRSVASTTGRSFVVRVRDGKIDWVDVKTGLTMGTLIEVFGNVHAGDTVAARGTDELRPGTDVKAVTAKGS